jgi:Flp pilus assembly protein CpaB
MNRMSLIIRQRILSIVFVIISIAGGIFIFLYVSNLKEKIPLSADYNRIFIAGISISRNEEITADLLVEQKIPADILSEKFILDKNEIIGEKTSVDIQEGEIITKDKLEGSGSGDGFSLSFSSYIPYGMRAVSIPVNFYGDRSLVKEGDKVDLISTYYEPAGSILFSETIMAEKEIILIGGNVEENYTGDEGGMGSLLSGPAADTGLFSSHNKNSLIITFYLSKSEAEEAYMAIERGTVNMSICCRN